MGSKPGYKWSDMGPYTSLFKQMGFTGEKVITHGTVELFFAPTALTGGTAHFVLEIASSCLEQKELFHGFIL